MELEFHTADGPATMRVTVGPRPVRCDSCGARFPLEETERSSGGRCTCGGDLIAEVEYHVRVIRPVEKIEFTIKVV